MKQIWANDRSKITLAYTVNRTHKNGDIWFEFRHNHFIEVHHRGVLKSVHGSIQAVVECGEQSLGSNFPLRHKVKLPRKHGGDAWNAGRKSKQLWFRQKDATWRRMNNLRTWVHEMCYKCLQEYTFLGWKVKKTRQLEYLYQCYLSIRLSSSLTKRVYLVNQHVDVSLIKMWVVAICT